MKAYFGRDAQRLLQRLLEGKLTRKQIAKREECREKGHPNGKMMDNPFQSRRFPHYRCPDCGAVYRVQVLVPNLSGDGDYQSHRLSPFGPPHTD